MISTARRWNTNLRDSIIFDVLMMCPIICFVTKSISSYILKEDIFKYI